MKYVKLTAKPDTWFVEGTEVWSYDEDRRLTKKEWESWNGFIVLVTGLRKCDPKFSYEKEYMEKHGVEFRIDGESCGRDEFEVEFVDNDGSQIIKEILKDNVQAEERRPEASEDSNGVNSASPPASCYASLVKRLRETLEVVHSIVDDLSELRIESCNPIRYPYPPYRPQTIPSECLTGLGCVRDECNCGLMIQKDYSGSGSFLPSNNPHPSQENGGKVQPPHKEGLKPSKPARFSEHPFYLEQIETTTQPTMRQTKDDIK